MMSKDEKKMSQLRACLAPFDMTETHIKKRGVSQKFFRPQITQIFTDCYFLKILYFNYLLSYKITRICENLRNLRSKKTFETLPITPLKPVMSSEAPQARSRDTCK